MTDDSQHVPNFQEIAFAGTPSKRCSNVDANMKDHHMTTVRHPTVEILRLDEIT